LWRRSRVERALPKSRKDAGPAAGADRMGAAITVTPGGAGAAPMAACTAASHPQLFLRREAGQATACISGPGSLTRGRGHALSGPRPGAVCHSPAEILFWRSGLVAIVHSQKSWFFDDILEDDRVVALRRERTDIIDRDRFFDTGDDIGVGLEIITQRIIERWRVLYGRRDARNLAHRNAYQRYLSSFANCPGQSMPAPSPNPFRTRTRALGRQVGCQSRLDLCGRIEDRFVLDRGSRKSDGQARPGTVAESNRQSL
jgi:hypothetical protein